MHQYRPPLKLHCEQSTYLKVRTSTQVPSCIDISVLEYPATRIAAISCCVHMLIMYMPPRAAARSSAQTARERRGHT
eukprot:SAG31_NODE_34480_length_332_cov_1.107296_1_plen_76_part_01